MALPPHWRADDETHRTAILTAFDLWFVAYAAGDMSGAARWQNTLRVLTEDAQARWAKPTALARRTFTVKCGAKYRRKVAT